MRAWQTSQAWQCCEKKQNKRAPEKASATEQEVIYAVFFHGAYGLVAEGSKALDLRSSPIMGRGFESRSNHFCAFLFYSMGVDSTEKNAYSDISDILRDAESTFPVARTQDSEMHLPLQKGRRYEEECINNSLLMDAKEYDAWPELESANLNTDMRQSLDVQVRTSSHISVGVEMTELSTPKKRRKPGRPKKNTWPSKDYTNTLYRRPTREMHEKLKKYITAQLIDPDESLDLETGLFSRSPQECEEIQLTLADVNEENRNLVAATKEPPREQLDYPYFPCFQNALGEKLLVPCKPKESPNPLDAARNLGFESMAWNNRFRITPARTRDVNHVLFIFKKVKRELFPLTRTDEEDHSLFSTFKWTWMANLDKIHAIRMRDVKVLKRLEVLMIRETKKTWLSNRPSVLKRISEKDEAPGVYMKVLVVATGVTKIQITDGLYAMNVALDAGLQTVANIMRVGTVLQVIGSRALQPKPVPIGQAYRSKTPIIELRYNGTKPCLPGLIGYQPHAAYLRSLSSIRPQGGVIGCLFLRLDRIVYTKYLMNLNGSKNIVDEARLYESFDKIEQNIRSMQIDDEDEKRIMGTVKVSKFEKYEVRSIYSRESVSAHLTIWNPPTDMVLCGRTFLFFFLNTSPRPPSNPNIITLTTNAYTIIKPVTNSHIL